MSLKSIIPIQKYILVTKLNENEVLKRLNDIVDARPKTTMMGMTFPHGVSTPYTGIVQGRHFEMSRVINYKNSFLPVITGDVESFLGKTEVKIKMSPHIGVLLFCAFWMFMVTMACLFVTYIMIQNGFEPMMLIPFGMAIFGTLLFTLPFRMEAKKSRLFLADLLEEEDVTIV